MYFPHTEADREAMCQRIGIKQLEDLFSPIPAAARCQEPLALPPALTELELSQHFAGLAEQNRSTSEAVCFLGGGSYDHFIPAVVDTIAARSEYYTAYTPYQAEASQGTLQTGFEFQTMLCQLTGLEVANASLYEGATAVVEAVLLARATYPNRKRILVSESVHPEYRQTLRTYLNNLQVDYVSLPCRELVTAEAELLAHLDDSVCCVVLQSPNFFGQLEPIAKWTAAIKEHRGTVIQVFDGTSLGLLARPGDCGVDIAVGEGQCLGNPMAFGGPYLGLFACREEFLRKIPGRVVGQTLDKHGQRCFVLTLQTREQHIRRDKATSNICSNQGLLALRTSVYLALLGPQGLRELSHRCWEKAHYAAALLQQLTGVELVGSDRFFKEFVIRLPEPAVGYLPALLQRGFHAGVPLSTWYPEHDRELLVAVTEKRTRAEIDRYVAAWREILS